MLRVFFPQTTELERRRLAMAVPPSVSPCTGLYDSVEIERLLEQVHAKYLPPGADAYCKKTWESVRQLLGALGLGDHLNEDSRNQLFDLLDVDRNGKVFQPSKIQPTHLLDSGRHVSLSVVCRSTKRTSYCGT